MRIKARHIGLLALTLLVCVTVGEAAPKPDKVAERDKALREADQKALKENMAAYDQDVKPFLEKHCIGCHGPKKLEGDLSLDLLDPDMKASVSGARWAVVREHLDTGKMPPEDKPRPSQAEIEKVLAWLKAEMKRARRNFTRRLQFVHGNDVPHDLLFDPKQSASLDVAPRLRRHSTDIYETFRREQAKGFENLVGNPFTPDPRFLFRDMGSPHLDVPTTSQLLRNALTIIQRQTGHTVEKGQLKPMIGARKEFLAFVRLLRGTDGHGRRNSGFARRVMLTSDCSIRRPEICCPALPGGVDDRWRCTEVGGLSPGDL